MSNRRTTRKSRRKFLAGGAGVAVGVMAQPCPTVAHAADKPDGKGVWTKVLELNEHRKPVHGRERWGQSLNSE